MLSQCECIGLALFIILNKYFKNMEDSMMNIWNELYNAAIKVQNARTISPFIDAGGVAAAILTKK